MHVSYTLNGEQHLTYMVDLHLGRAVVSPSPIALKEPSTPLSTSSSSSAVATPTTVAIREMVTPAPTRSDAGASVRDIQQQGLVDTPTAVAAQGPAAVQGWNGYTESYSLRLIRERVV